MKRGVGSRPIMKSEIEFAQSMAKSGAEAARILGVHHSTYKKWAKRYGIYENLINQGGAGVEKIPSKLYAKATPLQDIFDGKHPNYDIHTLKRRLIKELIMDECCSMCGFREKRLTDENVPLKLNHINGDKTDKRLENLELLCYNCWYLTVGNLYGDSPPSMKKNKRQSST